MSSAIQYKIRHSKSHGVSADFTSFSGDIPGIVKDGISTLHDRYGEANVPHFPSDYDLYDSEKNHIGKYRIERFWAPVFQVQEVAA